MEIIKDTSKQYKLLHQKEKEEDEKLQKEYQIFSNPKYVIFTCDKCKTVFKHTIEELKINDNFYTDIDYNVNTKSDIFVLKAWATCPTCNSHFSIEQKKHTKNFIIRFFNNLIGVLQ